LPAPQPTFDPILHWNNASSSICAIRHGSYEMDVMLRASALFLVLAIIAAVFGFVASGTSITFITKLIFLVLLLLFMVTLTVGVLRGNGH
jgi:uncharacterized membrane protein YtjA (UPF0391 family)